MKKIAIIPARGGSKRIPRKNIRDFLGKPIIAYSVEAAFESELFEEVIVSTDDQEISEVARQYGAKVPFLRSQENSDDFATTADVLLEVIGQLPAYEWGCCIYPTAPFVNSLKLQESFKYFQEQQFDALFPVVAFSSAIQRALKVDEQNKIQIFWPENLEKRSQDLDSAYYDAGQFYWFRPHQLEVKKKILSDNCGAIIYSSLEAHDIDYETDWKLAELKYQLLHAKT